VHAGETVPASRLIDELWRHKPPPGAVATLQTYVKNLRRVLEPDRRAHDPSRVLLTQASGYVLHVTDDSFDARKFEALARAARTARESGDPDTAVDRATAGLALWQGPAFGDLAGEEYVQAEAARLEELRIATIEERIEAE